MQPIFFESPLTAPLFSSPKEAISNRNTDVLRKQKISFARSFIA